ncbi:MAG TPA: tetraacyldisaccharide 4'-kinase [Alphaproteobacteria bacterium]|nr:tetraacyldisaccharide 4'-kinase [Alphaproteobacteria bacterium]HNS44624.1 tetraacyldisaccharide 4'-kinase [Alphaproteobacteria bacterium]
MKTPSFWYRRSASLCSLALSPVAALYSTLSGLHQAFAVPQESPIPVLCLGNLVAGGAGKTPTAIALAKLIESSRTFSSPMFVTRGYGGNVAGPERVDKTEEGGALVWGDEALLLARHAPTIVAEDRHAGAVYAHDTGADVVILDDGLQNYTVRKNVSFCVVDGLMGFGNGKLIPSGPMRQTFENGFRGVDAVILIGEDLAGARAKIPAMLPVFTAQIKTDASHLSGSYIAFCGIGYPEKFKKTLDDIGVSVVAFHGFADHYEFKATELDKLANEARAHNARLLTTEKDFVRIPECPAKPLIDILPIEVVFDAPESLLSFIQEKAAR